MAQDADRLITPHTNDVLLGKGNVINSHPGNQQFRLLVDSHKQIFANTNKKKVKRAIAMQIVNEIEKLQPPGRFLVEDHSRNGTERMQGTIDPDSNVHPAVMNKIWTVANLEKALGKIMHRLRERGTTDETAVMCGGGAVTSTSLDQERHHSVTESEGSNSSGMLQVRDDIARLSPAMNGGDIQFLPTTSLRAYRQDSYTGATFYKTAPNRNDTEIKEETGLDRGIRLSKYLKDHGLEFELDAEFPPQLDQNAPQHLREYTLRQWVTSSKPEISFDADTSLQSSIAVKKYIKSALLIAMKLTECILEAENDERQGHENPIPIASIAPENVLIRARVESKPAQFDEADEIIEFVWVMSFVGDESATGDVMARLFAVGKVLYELFSTRAMEDNVHNIHTSFMSSLQLSDEAEMDQPRKKAHWRSAKSDDDVSIASLESFGVPWSLCALVKNLLECRYGLLCEDGAYASFADLKADLQLMVNNPSCFLDNILVSTVPPKLEFPDKLYGRDAELLRLGELYKRHRSDNSINGVIVSGSSGVGKTKLLMHLQELTNQSDGYFLSAKFEQNQMSLKPLATISNLFGALCEKIFIDSSQSELKMIEDELISAIGRQSILLEVVPRLSKLMPSSCIEFNSYACSVDSALSMRYILGELMRVISSHSKPTVLFIDDIQFADDASLQLFGNLILSTQRTSTFFAFCHRDDEVCKGGSFDAWLTLVSTFSMETMKLESLTPEGVNNLISETLHLSNRITRPLSFALHFKTRGNVLFLRQLLDSLTNKGYIFIDLNQHRWAWDLDKIMKLDISDSVLALLTKEVERLPSDMQLGLQAASCIGSCLTDPILCCLSKDLGYDLKPILQQACQKGFMLEIVSSSMFCFTHDQIQEAVYGLMTDQQRRENHMRFGLALCNLTLNDSAEDEELFFAAVNQINQGGPESVHEHNQKIIIAELNLKAGRRAIDLSDYNTAFKLFQYGISFLGDDRWTMNYQLSIELYDSVSGAAFVLNKLATVKLYSGEVVSHARCFDDKLNSLCTITKALAAHSPEEAIDKFFGIILQFGELLPRTLEDYGLRADVDNMITVLQSMSDEMICNMPENKDRRLHTLFNLYESMSHYLQYLKPWLFESVSLRMIELTLKAGLSAKSPLAFANFGASLMSSGHVTESCRLGKLALRLVDKKGSYQYKSVVISVVYDLIFWASEPIHSIVEANMLGHKAGQQSGDIVIALKNLILSILNNYGAGQSLDAVQKSIMDFIANIHGLEIFLASPVLLLSQTTILRDGLDAAFVESLPSENEILSDTRTGPSISTAGKIHHLTRAFLFHQADDVSLRIDISRAVAENCHQLNPDILMGYFFEGLASFQLARQSSGAECANLVEKGLSTLKRMRNLSEHSVWNWENKMLLLEAESLYTEGNLFKSAGLLYDKAIQSAHEHKFIHEEAIASELAGNFYYERGFHDKSYSYFAHSVKSYEKWGARAVAKRLESDITRKTGTAIHLLESSADKTLDHLFATSGDSSKKHQLG